MTPSTLNASFMKIFLLVVLMSSFGLASQATAADHPVNWSFGVSQAPINAVVGDTLTFNYAGGHDVQEFPNQADLLGCDFTNATFIQGAGPAVINLNSVGTFYYGCGVGVHCANGAMTLEVTVSAPPAVPGANPYLVALAIACAGLLVARASRRKTLVV